MRAGQRTAGTRTFWDVVRSWFGTRRDPHEDLADLDAGRELVMVGYLVGEGRTQRHYLLLGGPVADAEAVLGPGPHRIFVTTGHPPRGLDGAFTLVEGADVTGLRWDLAIPKVDVPTFRSALQRMWPREERRRPLSADE